MKAVFDPDDPAPSCHAILFPEGVALPIASRPAKARQSRLLTSPLWKVLEGSSPCPPGYSHQVSQRVLTLHPSKLTRSGLCHPSLLAASVPMPAGSADSRQQPEGRQECMSLELLTALSRGCCFVACRVLCDLWRKYFMLWGGSW